MRLRILAIFALCSAAWAGTYTANTCNRGDVNECINNTGGTCVGGGHTAVDGDIIVIPAGTCNWTSGITVPANIGITIQGNGTPNSTPSTTGASSSCGSGTTLTLAGNFTAFTASPQFGNSTMRLSCLVSSYTSGGVIWLSILGTCTGSGCPNLRMDNVTFSNWAGHSSGGISYGITAVGDMFGVIDHNTITGVSGNYLQLVEQSNASYLGVGLYGDNSWAQTENYGSANFLYFENNAFVYSGISDNEGSAGNLTNQGGGREIGRFNTFTMDSLNAAIAWHGTESAGRPRGGRVWEFYGNTIGCPPSNFCQAQVGMRSGTGLTWGNTTNFPGGSGIGSFEALDTYRTQGNPGGTSWQNACDGGSGYDTDDGVTYYSGTVTNWNAGTSVVTVSGSPGWSANQWVSNGSPYSLHDVTQGNGTEITANGSNTLTLTIGGGPGAFTTPSNGDSIQLLRATVCIDQAGGRGASVAYNSACSPAGTGGGCSVVPANNAVSRTYEWFDTFSGATPVGAIVYSDTARVIQNRDFYNENVNQATQSNATTPFDGTTTIGMGHGTLARRPTTCTTGVGYFATDQGSWNTSGNGFGSGLFYACTSTNTWTLSYTPYSYPHPLENTGQTVQPTCDHGSGTYGGAFTNTCSTSSTGTVILCWATGATVPVTNGSGTGCNTGTQMTNGGSTTISSTETFNIVAGTSTLTDSPETTYSYTINSVTSTSAASNGAKLLNGATSK